ncbi:PLA2G4 [Mytilus coruscus]|uniref:PLA2G4 n=1 Tax=Mytilus coruscus TaxID=42192 RepID=A0A6J8D274_MYTCO|nr:PLA2G4 [Mytilus coruscus]
MAQRSKSTSTCQARSSQRRSLSINFSSCKQKGEDEYHTKSKSYSKEPNIIRRKQSFSHNRKFSRRSKVMYQAKCKSMIKVTFSPVPPPQDKYADIELHLEGTKGAPCTPKLSFKFFVNQDNLQNRLSADIIFKKDMIELERVPVFNLLDIDKAKAIAHETVHLQAYPPELTFSDLRTFDNNKGFLCDQEEKFQEKRKLYIHTALRKLLNTSLEGNDVPHIALMGSGGGYRAMVAMSGIINALYTTKVLDCILYTAVLSGSSWFIATLYSHPDWPNIDPKDIQKQLKHDISTNPIRITRLFSHVLNCGLGFFSSQWKGQSWDLTTGVFAPLLGDVLISDRKQCKWSEQKDKLSEGTVPLPLLSAIHAKEDQNTEKFHEWVEFSPYEVSIPKYGAAIEMKNFGSEFDKGLLTKRIDEIPLFEIMGICGSAYTLTLEELQNKGRQHPTTQNKKENELDKQESVVFDVVDGPHDDVLESGCDPHRIILSLTPIKESNANNVTENDDVFVEAEEENIQTQSIRSQPSKEEMEDLFQRVCQIRKENGRIFEEERTIAEPDELDSGIDYFKKFFMESRRYRAAMVNNFLRKVSFGDTDNCRLQGDPLSENYLKKDIEKLCLIDAGLAFNSPYPLLFKPGRDVDLILSFDFTDRKKDSNRPFKTLLTAEDWARKHEIKFPKINVDKYKDENVKELYIFEDENDPECPIIMHFVLVNKDFRTYKKPGVKRDETEKEFANFTIYDDQKTFNCTNFEYSAENFDRLSQLSEFIVLNNIVHIKACITKSIKNKQKPKQTGRQRHQSSPV